MKIREYYNSLNMSRTLLKGYIHLFYCLYIIYYDITQLPVILSFFFSSLLHIFDFDNLFIEKILFFLDYFFAIYVCYFAFVTKCSLYILNYLFNSVVIVLSLLTISFIYLINLNFSLFRLLYHIYFTILIILYFIILFPTNNINYNDIFCFYYRLIPIIFILIIKLIPYDLNNKYFDVHDIFQLLSVILIHIFIFYN